MAKKRNDALIEALALHLATGGRHEPWAKDHDVSVRTCWDWAALPECKALVRRHRKEIEDRILGHHAALAQAGTAKIAKLLKETENEALAFQIAKDVRDTYRSMLDRDEFERRLAALEEARNAGDHAE